MSSKFITSTLVAATLLGSVGIATAASNSIHTLDYDAHSSFLTVTSIFADQAGFLEIRAIDGDDRTSPTNFGTTLARTAVDAGSNGLTRVHLSAPAQEDLVAVLVDGSGQIISYDRVSMSSDR